MTRDEFFDQERARFLYELCCLEIAKRAKTEKRKVGKIVLTSEQIGDRLQWIKEEERDREREWRTKYREYVRERMREHLRQRGPAYRAPWLRGSLDRRLEKFKRARRRRAAALAGWETRRRNAARGSGRDDG